MKSYAIQWNESHTTLVRVDTMGRRSKRLRRLVRAARRGNLELAWQLMTGTKPEPTRPTGTGPITIGLPDGRVVQLGDWR